MDLNPVLDHSPWTVQFTSNMQQVFELFRTMGLRHIVVLDGSRVAGMITRKDLLPHTLRSVVRKIAHRRVSGGGDDLAADGSRGELLLTSDNDDDDASDAVDEDDAKQFGGGILGTLKAFFAPRYNVNEEELSRENSPSRRGGMPRRSDDGV